LQGSNACADAYLLSEAIRKKLIKKILPHFKIDSSSAEVSRLLVWAESIGWFRNVLAHPRGHMPSTSECRKGINDIYMILRSKCFACSPASSADRDALAKPDELLTVCMPTAIKYLLHQAFVLVERVVNYFFSQLDNEGWYFSCFYSGKNSINITNKFILL
jgi:hypothetical protein